MGEIGEARYEWLALLVVGAGPTVGPSLGLLAAGLLAQGGRCPSTVFLVRAPIREARNA
jgi:hypothetical protein